MLWAIVLPTFGVLVSTLHGDVKKIKGPVIDPQLVTLLSDGPPQKGPPIFGNSHIVLTRIRSKPATSTPSLFNMDPTDYPTYEDPPYKDHKVEPQFAETATFGNFGP